MCVVPGLLPKCVLLNIAFALGAGVGTTPLLEILSFDNRLPGRDYEFKLNHGQGMASPEWEPLISAA